MSFVKQLLCTVIVCYLCMSMGVTFTWPSPLRQLFASENTTLHRPMTETELSLFSSLSSVGALIATPVAGFLLDVVGRRYCTIVFSLTHVCQFDNVQTGRGNNFFECTPVEIDEFSAERGMLTVCWSMVIASNRVEVLLAAIFLSGVGGAAFLVVPLYISEICQESIRGAMTSFTMLFYAIGMIISYAIGGFMDYYPMVGVCLGVSVVGIILLSIMKESPMFLLMKGREQEAKISMGFFRSRHPESKEVLTEIENMRRTLNPQLDEPDTPEEFKLTPAEQVEKFSTLQFVKKSYATRRALFVALVIMTTSIFQGLVAVQVFAESLFHETNPSTPSAVWSVLLSIFTVVSGLLAAYLTERAGRKALLTYSSIASGVCCVLLGLQIHLRLGPPGVTIALIFLFCIAYTLGPGTIPYVLGAELFLPEIKSFAAMLVTEWAWLCNFVLLFVFTPLVGAVGVGQVFYIFAAICFATAAFTTCFLPETKGKSVDAIQTLFSKKKVRLPSRP